MDASYNRLARRQLSSAIAAYLTAVATPRPRDGWIASMRDALDMTVRQFAARLGVSPSSVVRLEQRERDDAITLGTLRRAADALECDLVYAIVPRVVASPQRTERMLDTLIQTRARQVAEAQLTPVAHSMALEGQGVSADELEAQISERAEALAEAPRSLWDLDIPASEVHSKPGSKRSR